MRADGIDARLVIAGEDADSGTGQFRRDLEGLVAELNLATYVRLPGALSEADVRKELEAAHVFGLSSDTEALGIVMVEAMAMRVPVVTTDVGGTTELVKDGTNGLAVPPRDPAALAAAIRRIATDPATGPAVQRRRPGDGRGRLRQRAECGRNCERIPRARRPV